MPNAVAEHKPLVDLPSHMELVDDGQTILVHRDDKEKRIPIEEWLEMREHAMVSSLARQFLRERRPDAFKFRQEHPLESQFDSEDDDE